VQLKSPRFKLTIDDGEDSTAFLKNKVGSALESLPSGGLRNVYGVFDL